MITARSDKEGAAPTFKKGYGFHPLGAWLANTSESLAMLLRPGNAGSNTFADHAAVLTAAIRQIPPRMRSRLLVRVDGAGASHELIAHLLSLASPRRHVLFTCFRDLTSAREAAEAPRQLAELITHRSLDVVCSGLNLLWQRTLFLTTALFNEESSEPPVEPSAT